MACLQQESPVRWDAYFMGLGTVTAITAIDRCIHNKEEKLWCAIGACMHADISSWHACRKGACCVRLFLAADG